MTTTTSEKLSQLRRAFLAAAGKNQWEQAKALGLEAYALASDQVTIMSDLITAAVHCNDMDLVLAVGPRILALDPKHLNTYDGLAHAYSAQRQLDSCRKYGRRALELRDERFLAAHPQLPELPPKPAADGLKVLSFSLFGNAPKYCEVAVMNAVARPYIYPDWQMRVYHDTSVPEEVLQRLRAEGVVTLLVEESMRRWPGAMWRFLALDDPEVTRVCFRDIDSLINWREAKAVRSWEQSGQRFHIMRDFGSHTELVMAGTWGALGGSIPKLTEKMRSYLATNPQNRHFADQFFLREYAWGYIRQDLCQHDRMFGFMDAPDFPHDPHFDDHLFHVGCCISTKTFTAELNPEKYPEGSTVYFSIHSRVEPITTQEYAPLYRDQERHWGRYPAIVRGGKIQALIPNPFADGLAQNYSRITVDKGV